MQTLFGRLSTLLLVVLLFSYFASGKPNIHKQSAGDTPGLYALDFQEKTDTSRKKKEQTTAKKTKSKSSDDEFENDAKSIWEDIKKDVKGVTKDKNSGSSKKSAESKKPAEKEPKKEKPDNR